MLFVLFCFSVCVEPVSAEGEDCVLFSYAGTDTHTLKRNQPIAHHPVSTLTPVPDSPSVFSRFASFALCPACEIYGSLLKWIGIQRSWRICKCFNRWNPCIAMDVSVQPCGLHEHHCTSVCARSRILAYVFRSPRDISVNTHILHIPPVACMWVAWVR